MSTLGPSPTFALGLLLAVNNSGAVGAIFLPVGARQEQRPAPTAAFAVPLVEQRRFQFPVQRQDCGPEVSADQRPGNALDTDAGFPAIVQQQTVPIIVVAALMHQPSNTLNAGRSFPTVADEWEREHEKKVGEATRVSYRVVVKRLKEHFPGAVKDYRPLDVQRYITSLENEGRAASSVQVDLIVIRMIFAHAVLAGDIDISPAVEVKKSRGLPKKARTALTEEQEEKIKTGWDTAHFGLFPYFLLYTGMRRGRLWPSPTPTLIGRKG